MVLGFECLICEFVNWYWKFVLSVMGFGLVYVCERVEFVRFG